LVALMLAVPSAPLPPRRLHHSMSFVQPSAKLFNGQPSGIDCTRNRNVGKVLSAMPAAGCGAFPLLWQDF